MTKPDAAFDPRSRQPGVRRTAAWLVAAAVLVYAGFMLMTAAGQ